MRNMSVQPSSQLQDPAWDPDQVSEKGVEAYMHQVEVEQLKKLAARHDECCDLYLKIGDSPQATDKLLQSLTKIRDPRARRAALMALGFDEDTARGFSHRLQNNWKCINNQGIAPLTEGIVTREQIQRALYRQAMLHNELAQFIREHGGLRNYSTQTGCNANKILVTNNSTAQNALQDTAASFAAKGLSNVAMGISVYNNLVDHFGDNPDWETAKLKASTSQISIGELTRASYKDGELRGKAIIALILTPIPFSGTAISMLSDDPDVPQNLDKLYIHDFLTNAVS
jgi:hypothetical protein